MTFQLNVNISDRLRRVIDIAQKEATSYKFQVISPEHLFIGAILENTGTLKGLYQLFNDDIDIIRDKSLANSEPTCIIYTNFTSIPLSKASSLVFEKGIQYMKNYNQIYLNEGHIIKAIWETNDPQTLKCLERIDKNKVFSITTVARDLECSLELYEFPVKKINNYAINIKRVTQQDRLHVLEYLKKEYSFQWYETIRSLFQENKFSAFIALDAKEIVGFAAYDATKSKNEVFGPMGVSMCKRKKGIGFSLLHYCLKDMKEKGYKNIIIDNAGPIEFYERSCNATVIE